MLQLHEIPAHDCRYNLFCIVGGIRSISYEYTLRGISSA